MSDEDEFSKEMKLAHEQIGNAVHAYFGVERNGGKQEVSLEKMAAALITMERMQTFLIETLAVQGIDRDAVTRLMTAGKEHDQKTVNELLDKDKALYDDIKKRNQWGAKEPKAGS